MSYEDKTIKEVITLISDNKIYLPAIQRKFIWKPDQILSFFDSIMKGYPIGTFLFWKLKGKKTINQYTFYKFIQEYHQRDKALNEIAPSPHRHGEITGVLDGQQRLSSLYIALQGTYSYKQPYRRWDDDYAFPKTRLCLNLLESPNEEDEDEEEDEFEFKFLTDSEIEKNDEKHFWLPIKKVLEWKKDSEYIKYAKSVNQLENDIFLSNLTTLWNKITKDKLISYFEVLEEDLDKIVKIFIRVNMGGTILSKTDLLFSTIVANWQEGREEIETLLESINQKGEGFYFNNDFIMRSCLVLTDSPVLFKVKTFKKANILKIKDDWDNIKNSIQKAVDLLVELGYNGYNLTSQMAVTIIAYFIYKGGPLTKENKEAIRKYLVLSMLNRIYGGRPDQVITKIRDALRTKNEEKDYILKQDKFSLTDIEKNMTFEKSLSIKDEELEEILEFEKGPYTFMVLSLLYPNLKLNQVKFHQDHIHPNSFLYDYDKMAEAGVPEEKYYDYYSKKDKLPNLQLLEGSENESKNQTLFSEWFKKIKDKKKYKKDNYIPEKVSLEIADFDVFFEKRKELLKNKIKKILKI